VNWNGADKGETDLKEYRTQEKQNSLCVQKYRKMSSL
jgi:hypothetical protein